MSSLSAWSYLEGEPHIYSGTQSEFGPFSCYFCCSDHHDCYCSVMETKSEISGGAYLI
jgi:hypothetical protein